MADSTLASRVSLVAVLKTAGEVIDVVGGTAAAARLTGGSMGSVSNWRASGRLPPTTFLIFQFALSLKGAIAPSMLWGIRPVTAIVDGVAVAQ